MSSERGRFRLIRRISKIFGEAFDSENNIGALSNTITNSIRDYLSHAAPYYGDIKQKNNQLAKQLLPSARRYIEKGRGLEERIKRACRLASAANVSPMRAPAGAFRFQEAIGILRGRRPLPSLIGNIFEVIQKANRILYLTDNAGEIGFDSLLISMLGEMGAKVSLVVREGPFFEDATLEDALFFSMDKLVDHIFAVHGFFIPGSNISQLSDVFKKSELLISKGTGNYEALNAHPPVKNTLFMLKVKCKPVALNTGVPVGTFVVQSGPSRS